MVGTNYILCSVGPKRKQNKNKQTKIPQIPKKQQGMQEVLQNILIQTGVINEALLSLTHIQLCYLPCVLSYSSTDQMGDLRNGQAIQPFSLPLHDFPFPLFPPPGLESVSSMKEVLLMMGKGMKQDFHNTDLASSKPCCVQFTQRGGGCEGSLMEL